MVKFIFRLLAVLTGNSFSQKLLELVARGNLALLGIGNGAGVHKSGEEGAVLNILKPNKKEKYVIFDVGGNQGQFLSMAHAAMLKNVRAEAFKIYSFEPSQFTFEILQKNCGLLENVILNHLGLGNSEQKSTLFYDKIGSGKASQSKRDLKFLNMELNMEEQIEIQTLDSYCERSGITLIDLLKIDVEGYEMDVLDGANQMINKGKIRSIMFEFGGANIDTRSYFKDFYYFFNNKKYQLYRITPSGYLHHLTNYKEIYEQYTTTNFLAILNT